MQPIESRRKPDLWRILNIVSYGLIWVALAVFIVLSKRYPALMGSRDSELGVAPAYLFVSVSFLPAYIALALVNRRLPHRQHWVAVLSDNLNTRLERRPTHTAHFRADTPLFEQDILQIKGAETYILLRRITEDTLDFCTVPYAESPRLPDEIILHDGVQDVAELSAVRSFSESAAAYAADPH